MTLMNGQDPSRPRPPAGRTLRLAAGLALLGLAACSDAGDADGTARTAPVAGVMQAPPTEVGFVTLHPREVAFAADVAGRVTAFQTAQIRPQVNGLVTERVFVEGSDVAAGDILYRLDPQSYEATVAAAEASLKRAQAGLASAEAQANRYRNLSDSRVVSQAERENAEAAFLQAQADVAVAEADLRTARINLGHTTVTAPIAGRIGTSNVGAGSLVTANQTDTLATIRQVDPIYVDFTESSGNLLKFRSQIRQASARSLVDKGGRAEVRLSFADGTPYDEVGSIDAAEQFVSATTSSFTVRSSFANPEGLLLPGMYVRGTVRVAIDETAFLVPQRAVARNAEGEATAMFVAADGRVEPRVIAVSTDIGTDWLVTAGVTDGDRLIVDGLQKVRPGQFVSPVEVALDANGIVRPAGAGAAVSKAGAEATSLSTTGGGSSGAE